MHSHHHHAPGVWHHRTTTTTLECCKSRRTSSARLQDYFFLRSPLRIGCSHSSTTSSIFNDIYRDDETFSKDASRRVAMREAEMKPDTYKHPDDSFYGEIDADSMLELIDVGTEDWTFYGLKWSSEFRQKSWFALAPTFPAHVMVCRIRSSYTSRIANTVV